MNRWGIGLILVVLGAPLWASSGTPIDDLHQILSRMKQFSIEVDQSEARWNPSPNLASTRKPKLIRYQFEPTNTVGGFGSIRFKFNSPSGIGVDARYIYIADRGNGRIVKMDHAMRHWDEFIIQNERDYPLDSPSNLGIFGSMVTVADTHNNRVVQFRDDGTFVGKWGQLGIGAGEFDSPVAVGQNTRRELFIVDQRNHRIQRFSDQNHYVSEFGAMGADEELLIHATDIVVLPDDRMIVADSGTATIRIYDPEGRWISQFSGRFKSIGGIAIDDRGMIFIADTRSGKVMVYSQTGEWVGEFDTPAPADVAVWGDWVFVTDHIGHCIHQFRRIPG